MGYVILGELIEKVSGTTYEQYINEHIIKQLGLNKIELGFQIIDYDNHAKGYQKNISFLNLLLVFFIDKSKFMSAPEGKWKPFRHFYVNGSAYGGLIGAPAAFIVYLQELLKTNSKIISDASKTNLFTENRNNHNETTGMCLSWFHGQLEGINYFAHAGGGGGYYCELRVYPDIGIGSVIFFNRTGMSDERFLNKVDRIYFKNNNLI